jgi:hypothetical protein
MEISQLTCQLRKGNNGTHGDFNCLLEDLITNDYKHAVNEEPHLFNVNFMVLVRGVGVVDNKVCTWIFDY